MNFQKIPPVENADFYLDLAIRKAKARGAQIRQTAMTKDRLKKAKHIEKTKIEAVTTILHDLAHSLQQSFPQLDDLPEFYQELIRITLDYDKLKKALGSLPWLQQQIIKQKQQALADFRDCETPAALTQRSKQFYGRVASFMKRINKELKYLEKARKQLRSFPAIKTSLKTVAIAGFPNVGKTTLLYKLTGSKPEINSYAFTTKGINVAYLDKAAQHQEGKRKSKKERLVQILDTPGTLNRFEKMNIIEKQAHLAIKDVADIIIYVFDLTETSYPLDVQEKLYQVTKDFNKKIIIYLSKTDLLDKQTVTAFDKPHITLSQLKKELLTL